jgi:hypothetical protein
MPRHRLATLRQHQKEKMSLAFSDFRGGDFFLKWKGHFSFWCSAFQVFRQCGGAKANSVTSRCSAPPSLPLAFSILVLFARDFFFGMVRGVRAGFL